MAVDRLSVTVPSEIGSAIRALAKKRGDSVSTLVTEAIAQRLRLAALDAAITEAERSFGEIPGKVLAEAEAELTSVRGRRKRHGRRR